MNEATRKDTIASVIVLAAILVSVLCGALAIDVQATTGIEVRQAPAACATQLA